MPKQVASILLFAAPLHMGVTVFIYSHQCTFPSSALGVSNVIESVTNMSTESSSSELSYLDRFTRQSTWMTAFGLGILIALWLFWIVLQILGASFGEMLKCLCVFLKPSLTEEEWTTVVVDGASGTTDVPTRVAPGNTCHSLRAEYVLHDPGYLLHSTHLRLGFGAQRWFHAVCSLLMQEVFVSLMIVMRGVPASLLTSKEKGKESVPSILRPSVRPKRNVRGVSCSRFQYGATVDRVTADGTVMFKL